MTQNSEKKKGLFSIPILTSVHTTAKHVEIVWNYSKMWKTKTKTNLHTLTRRCLLAFWVNKACASSWCQRTKIGLPWQKIISLTLFFKRTMFELNTMFIPSEMHIGFSSTHGASRTNTSTALLEYGIRPNIKNVACTKENPDAWICAHMGMLAY